MTNETENKTGIINLAETTIKQSIGSALSFADLTAYFLGKNENPFTSPENVAEVFLNYDKKLTQYVSKFVDVVLDKLIDFYKAYRFILSELSAYTYEVERDAFEKERPIRCDVDTAIKFCYYNLFTEDETADFLGKLGINDFYARVYYYANRKLPTYFELTRAYFREIITMDEYLAEMKKLGYDEFYARVFLATHLNLPSETEIAVAYMRGFIDEQTHDKLLTWMGYPEEFISFKKKLYWHYPGVEDWIRFAVKDVFNEKWVRFAGYDEQFPEEIVPYVEKAGISREVLKWYWRAHWQTVSPTMIFEMLHRDVITRSEAEMMLKIADYPKYLIDKILKISYVPYTRVDIRRMYAIGVLNKDEVFKAYKELGYDEEKAHKLTEFTVKYLTGEKKSLTLSKIEKGYKRRWFNKEETIALLKDAGYDEDVAELLTLYWDLEIKEEITENQIEAIKSQYLRGIIDDYTFIKRLTELDIPSNEIDYIIETAKTEKEARQITLSVKDIIDAYLYNLISEHEAIKRLKRKGYSEDDARLKIELEKYRKTRKVIEK